MAAPPTRRAAPLPCPAGDGVPAAACPPGSDCTDTQRLQAAGCTRHPTATYRRVSGCTATLHTCIPGVGVYGCSAPKYSSRLRVYSYSTSQLHQATGCTATQHLMSSAHATTPLGVRMQDGSTRCQVAPLPNIHISPSVTATHGLQHVCVHPSGVRAHEFVLPLGAGMCVHVHTTPRCRHRHRHMHEVLGCRHLHATRQTHAHLLGGRGAHAHTQLLAQMCTCVLGIGSRHICFLHVGDAEAPKLGWIYTHFFLPFFETGKAAVSNLRIGSSPCARLKAPLQAAV